MNYGLSLVLPGEPDFARVSSPRPEEVVPGAEREHRTERGRVEGRFVEEREVKEELHGDEEREGQFGYDLVLVEEPDGPRRGHVEQDRKDQLQEPGLDSIGFEDESEK